MTATLLTFPVFRAFDSNGAPLAGGLLYSYQAGTTTPLATYVDQAGVTQNTNPVVLDSTGTANVWLGDSTYKLVLKDKDGVQQWSVDNVFDSGAVALSQLTNYTLKTDLASTATGKGSSLVGWKSSLIGGVARTQFDKNSDFISIKDFGAVGNGTDDDTDAIQAAFDYSASHSVGIWFPVGTYMVSKTLKLGTSTIIRGESWISTIIKMSAVPSGAKPSYTGSTAYAPTLDYFPVIWNASPIQWYEISNITIDGNNLDVYGLRLQENFYGRLCNVLITNCNKAPYINVRGQSIHHEHFVIYQNKAGIICYNNTAMAFQTCGFERTGTTGYVVNVIAPFGTKSGISFRECWFEDDVAPYNTTGGYIGISGRNPVVDNCFFASIGTPHIIDLNGVAYSFTFDNITATNDWGSLCGRFNVNATYNGAISISVDSGANDFSGFFSNSLITDLSQGSSFTGSISGTTLTVTSVNGGYIGVGQQLAGSGISTTVKISSVISASGGVGTYTLDSDQGTITSQAFTTFAPSQGGGNTFNFSSNQSKPSPQFTSRLTVKNGITGIVAPISDSANVLDANWNNGLPYVHFSGDVSCISTAGAFYPPILTTTQKNALSPSAGAVVYDSTLSKLQCYSGGSWQNLF